MVDESCRVENFHNGSELTSELENRGLDIALSSRHRRDTSRGAPPKPNRRSKRFHYLLQVSLQVRTHLRALLPTWGPRTLLYTVEDYRAHVLSNRFLIRGLQVQFLPRLPLFSTAYGQSPGKITASLLQAGRNSNRNWHLPPIRWQEPPRGKPPGRLNVELASLTNAILAYQKKPLTQVELYAALQAAGAELPRDPEAFRLWLHRARKQDLVEAT